jgi:hypothetical protein
MTLAGSEESSDDPSSAQMPAQPPLGPTHSTRERRPGPCLSGREWGNDGGNVTGGGKTEL